MYTVNQSHASSLAHFCLMRMTSNFYQMRLTRRKQQNYSISEKHMFRRQIDTDSKRLRVEDKYPNVTIIEWQFYFRNRFKSEKNCFYAGCFCCCFFSFISLLLFTKLNSQNITSWAIRYIIFWQKLRNFLKIKG